MRSPWLWALSAALAVSAAAPQSAPEADSRAREYVQFLVTQLDQWTRDFPQEYNMALVRPPVDASALTEAAKAGATNLRDCVASLASLKAQDSAFHTQLEKTVLAAAPVNEALGKQRFPEAIQNDWVQIRTTLNSLAGIYKISELAFFEAPGAGSGGKGSKAAAAIPAGAVTGYIVDQRCADKGKAMWTNAKCVETCVRDGDKVVLVTDQGKVIQISNLDKVDAETYGQKVAVTGKTGSGVITIATIQIL